MIILIPTKHNTAEVAVHVTFRKTRNLVAVLMMLPSQSEHAGKQHKTARSRNTIPWDPLRQ